MIAAVRRLWRLPQVIALLFGGLFTVIVLFPFWREPARRTAIRVWSRMLLAGCGLRLSECTAPGARPLHALPPGRLVVANHLSWLDIFAIDALCPASFVAKSEIARWPLVGTLVARAGTLFIERGRRHAVHRLIEHIERSLQAGGRVAVFPEGTTGAAVSCGAISGSACTSQTMPPAPSTRHIDATKVTSPEKSVACAAPPRASR
ncbi:MAG: 1-acyl-sn-glycerol-3-phosphate acyltransferase [Burkholderiaceae bacterium]|nr:MAG: 1-acyl-sn-glycerol-3-phosphate acyltransferase [Burkholderiaceae bacterium]